MLKNFGAEGCLQCKLHSVCSVSFEDSWNHIGCFGLLLPLQTWSFCAVQQIEGTMLLLIILHSANRLNYHSYYSCATAITLLLCSSHFEYSRSCDSSTKAAVIQLFLKAASFGRQAEHNVHYKRISLFLFWCSFKKILCNCTTIQIFSLFLLRCWEPSQENICHHSQPQQPHISSITNRSIFIVLLVKTILQE